MNFISRDLEGKQTTRHPPKKNGPICTKRCSIFRAPTAALFKRCLYSSLINMEKKEYEQKTKALFNRWKQARPEYNFVHDGIVDFDAWSEAKPKTLFLLKENPAEDWEPEEGLTTSSGPFSSNLVRWHHALKCLLTDYSKTPIFEVAGLPKVVTDIALVEVKKTNQRLRTSPRNDILGFAKQDKKFIKDQIEIIQPQVIVCCGPDIGDAYEKIIYGDESWLPIELSIVALTKDDENLPLCFDHRGRLVIDFYHPSIHPANPRSAEDIFQMLCKMIRQGRVFDKFDWSKAVPR